MTKKEKANMAYFMVIHLLALSLMFLNGCATAGKSAALGGGIGAGVGAIAGGLADPGRDGEYRTRNVVIGTALGGMAGLAAGSLIHNEVEDQKREAFQKGAASSPSPKNGTMPALKTPRVESKWIDAHVVGNKFIDGHFEYIITEPTRWDDGQ